MKTLRPILAGLAFSVLIFYLVNASVGRFDLFTLLKLRGCESGCNEEAIREVLSYQQVMMDTTLTIITSDYKVIYTLEVFTDGEVEVTKIMNLREQKK